MGGITIFAIILSQLDKVILSKLLSLEMFGYYILAGTVCNVVPNMLVGPVFNALFPKFSALVAQGDEIELTRLYHQGTQLMTVIVVPVALVLAFFSYDVLLLWTRSVRTAGEAAPIVSILIFGMALNALMNLPYALQLSHGWTSIGLRITLFLIVTLVPAIIYMTMRYGAIGAASVWVCLNAIYMLIGAPLTHRRLLRHELSHWAMKDIGIPVLAALTVTGMGRWMASSPMTPLRTIMTVGIVLLIALSAASLTATHVRAWIFMKLFRTGAAHA
jgi:O-antigen/teichoic acid export membrane protein